MRENRENTDDKSTKTDDLYAYSLKHSNIATTIPIGQGDYEILQMYRHVLKKPMRLIERRTNNEKC